MKAYGSPSFNWIIASAVVGLIIGFSVNALRLHDGYFGKKQLVLFNVFQIIANGIAWGIVAPTLDILIYAEPSNKVYIQGVVSGLSNTITIGILGSILLASYAKTRIKTGS